MGRRWLLGSIVLCAAAGCQAVAHRPADMPGDRAPHPSSTPEARRNAPTRTPAVQTVNTQPADDSAQPISALESWPPLDEPRSADPLDDVAQATVYRTTYQPAEPAPSASEHEPPWTLEDLRRIAWENNPALAEAAARVAAARGKWLQVGLPPNPVVGYLGSEIGNEGQAGQQGLFVQQEFVRGGKLGWNRAVAAGELSVAQQQLAAVQQRLETDVRLAYFDVLLAQRQVQLATQLRSIAEQAQRATEALFQAQELSRVELLQAGVEAQRAQIAVSNAHNAADAAWRRLTAVLGTPDAPPRPLAGQVEEAVVSLTWEAALQRVLDDNPQLAAAQAEVQRARSALQRAMAEPVPNVEVLGSLQYDDASHTTIAGLQVGWTVPVRNANQGGIQQAQSELIAAQRALQRVALDLQYRLAQRYERYANAAQQVERYRRDILPRVEESRRLVEQGYRAGEVSFLTLLTVQRTYFETQAAYLNALAEAVAAGAEIEGMLLRDSLGGTP
jgi:cobalt-zinc-cadmium efflux system outer membrane protein